MKGESNYRDLLLFVLGINTGLRISDILALKWSSFINGGGRLLKAGDQLNVVEIKTKKIKKLYDKQVSLRSLEAVSRFPGKY